MAGKYEIKKNAGQFRFNLKAANGKIVLSSERYTTKESARSGIESVRKNGPSDGRYDRRVAKNGEPYFVLLAANGEIIGRSETYSSRAAMERGIASVQRHAKGASIDDTTE